VILDARTSKTFEIYNSFFLFLSDDKQD